MPLVDGREPGSFHESDHDPIREAVERRLSELESILFEHKRVMEGKNEFDGGLGLHVGTGEDHALHMAEHTRFLQDTDEVRPQFRSKLEAHIELHRKVAEEATRLGIGPMSPPVLVMQQVA